MPGNKRWIHGRAVDPKTRELRFLSVSAIESADTCGRKWWYEKIDGRKTPESPWQARGVEGHAQVARYEQYGDRSFSPMVARGAHMLLDPGPDLLVEWELLLRPGVAYPEPLTEAHSPSLLANAPLKLAGVGVLGQLDLSHGRGINRGADGYETDQRDPDGTIEVCDWKFVGGDKYLKTPDQLRETTQMACYGEWVFLVRPETPFVRLSHGYFVERGRPRKVTTLVTREQIQAQVEHATGVARTMQRAAQCTDPETVDANTDACDKFGGCPHRPYCSAPRKKTFAAIAGVTATESLKNPDQRIIPVASLLNRANAGAPAQNTQPAPAPAQTGSMLRPPQAAPQGPSAAEIAAERQRLEMEERAARLKALVPAGFDQACSAVRAFNRGFPKLFGAAAQAYAAMGGQAVAPDAVFPGQGEISYVEIDDPLAVSALAGELAKDAAAGPRVSPIPPDAPASDPALAAQVGAPAATFAETTTQAAQETMPPFVPKASTPPDPMTAAKPEQMPAAGTTTPPTAPAKKPRASRAAKAAAEATEQSESFGEKPGEGAEFVLYIDCATNRKTASLNDWAQEQADKLAKKWGAIDIRCGAEDSAIGYDKWKGALVAWCRDEKLSPLPPGAYSLSARFSSVMLAIAEGLSLRVRELGGEVIWGVR